jgi:hypothetical protein
MVEPKLAIRVARIIPTSLISAYITPSIASGDSVSLSPTFAFVERGVTALLFYWVIFTMECLHSGPENQYTFDKGRVLIAQPVSRGY